MEYKGERQRRNDRRVNGASRAALSRYAASPLLSMVRESLTMVVSGASLIPFERWSRS